MPNQAIGIPGDRTQNLFISTRYFWTGMPFQILRQSLDYRQRGTKLMRDIHKETSFQRIFFLQFLLGLFQQPCTFLYLTLQLGLAKLIPAHPALIGDTQQYAYNHEYQQNKPPRPPPRRKDPDRFGNGSAPIGTIAGSFHPKHIVSRW